jgi:hypothetical protein
MRPTLAIVFGLALSGCDGTSRGETTADVRCLAAIGRLPEVNAQNQLFTEEGVNTLTALGSLYYLGRVQAREPRLDLENALIVEILAMDPEDIRTELARCSEEMSVAGAKWEVVGKNLVRRGQRQNPASQQSENLIR